MARHTLVILVAAALVVALPSARTVSSAAPYYRNPVVLSVAPDEVDCESPDDPDGVEDVQIAGLCFFGSIAAAFLSTSPDGSGAPISLSNVVNVGRNVVTATVPLSQLAASSGPYYVFVVRGTDGKVSTSYPNAFGYDVTFTCVSGASTPVGDVFLTSCKVVRVSGGRLVLQVFAPGLRPNDTVILLDGVPCARMKYPTRFFEPAANTTTRIDCHGNLRRLLPAVVTTLTRSTGQVSLNSLNCGL